MRFDGYGATIRTENPREIALCLADALDTKPEKGPAIRRFGVTTGFNVGPKLAVWMGIDPNPDTDIVYIEAKGETTPAWSMPSGASSPYTASLVWTCARTTTNPALSSVCRPLYGPARGQR